MSSRTHMTVEAREHTYRAVPSQAFYGAPIGILLLDCVAPWIPGSVGNASTYSKPVRYKVVPGMTVERVLFDPAPETEQAIVEAARELVAEGAKMVTANCGFTIRFQKAVREAVDAPVLLSSLLLAPFLVSMLPGNTRLGVITANAGSLTPDLLQLAGISDPSRLAIKGLDDAPAFNDAIIACNGSIDVEQVREETVNAAVELVEQEGDIGIILLECSELPPYAAAVQRATNLPVFDFISMIEFFAEGLYRREFDGIY
jgi:aspartate/glutamate racemase